MGRRPNPLVGEFFERGEKLDNASNRYQHTCKRCGELFPKGRIDNLLAHVYKRCPNVSEAERNWVFQLYELNPEGRKTGKKGANALEIDGAEIAQPEYQPDTLVQSIGQRQQQQQQSALDTLAEVSRRHLDFSTQRPLNNGASEQEQQAIGQMLAEQALMAHLQHHNSALEAPSTTTDFSSLLNSVSEAPVLSSQITSAEFVVPDAQTLSTGPTESSATFQHPEPSTTSITQSGSLSTTIDPHLDNEMIVDHTTPTGPTDMETTRPDAAQPSPWNTSNSTISTQAASLALAASNEPMSGFGAMQKSAKQKKRARFEDNRRKEVDQMRKKGACIRCRMLKKPCSAETPCNTCRSVESARLWKGLCIRTKLSEECPLWSASLFKRRAQIASSAATAGLRRASPPGQIYTHFCQPTDVRLGFSGQAYGAASVAGVDTGVQTGADHSSSEPVLLLDEDGDKSRELERYIKHCADSCIENEDSVFIRSTLQRAQILVRAEDAEEASRAVELNEQQPSRPCYNFQPGLLKDVVELWVETRFLTSPETYGLTIRKTSTPGANGYFSSSVEQAEVEALVETELEQSSLSHKIITAQVLAVIEGRSNTLSKNVINELEKRLMQRQQTSRISTFLAAIIMLNCIERMSGFYRTLNINEAHNISNQPRDDDDKDNGGGSPSKLQLPSLIGLTERTLESSTWPLHQPPSDFWHQGEKTAELLITLLRIRALPPSVVRHADGTLVVMQDISISHPGGNNGPVVKESSADESAKVCEEWLDPMKLKVDELVSIRDAEVPAADRGLEAWDMRFISQVLMPKNMT